jgi:hypothetical protein
MSAAVDSFIFLHAMPDYPAPAVGAGRSQGMNGTFEAVEDMFFPADANFKGLVVIVSASFTFGHVR